MVAIVFKDQEAQYQEWIRTNPQGYVLTTYRKASPAYMSLHRGNCRTIREYSKNMADDAFTGQGYIKICSGSAGELERWITEHGGDGFTSLCSRCNPVPDDSVHSLEQIHSRFDEEVQRSRSDAVGRAQRLRKALKKPEVQSVIVLVFKRNPDVVAEVLERADGLCERCKMPAPFRRAKDGTPYLEVHHKVTLADGGDDTVDNALALCPNCHREVHYGHAAARNRA